MNISRRGVSRGGLAAIGCGVIDKTGAAGADAVGREDTEKSLELCPVGRVDTKADPAKLQIHKKYRDALRWLDGFSHAVVLYWFDRNDTPAKRSILHVHPRGKKKNPLTGVFACRSPARPNLIALGVCKILAVSEQEVSIDKIDALDGSLILDIRPYIPSVDCRTEGVRVPDWLKG